MTATETVARLAETMRLTVARFTWHHAATIKALSYLCAAETAQGHLCDPYEHTTKIDQSPFVETKGWPSQ